MQLRSPSREDKRGGRGKNDNVPLFNGRPGGVSTTAWSSGRGYCHRKSYNPGPYKNAYSAWCIVIDESTSTLLQGLS